MVVIIIQQENKKYKPNDRIGIWGIFQGRETLWVGIFTFSKMDMEIIVGPGYQVIGTE